MSPVLALELAAGALTQLSGKDLHDKKQVVTGLQGPTQMVLGKDGAVYITELAGRLLRVDPSNWAMSTVTEGLAGPEGLAQTPAGKFIVAEAAKRQLTEVDPANGSKRVIATDLPIGFEAGPGTSAVQGMKPARQPHQQQHRQAQSGGADKKPGIAASVHRHA